MKRILIGTFAFLLIAGVSAANSRVNLAGLRFGAPTVADKSNVYSPEVGDIIYDSSDSKFYGYSQAGSWTDLSAGTPNDFVPAGALMPFAGATPPVGYLPADGSAVSRVTYAALFTAIGTTYGAGDGSTTFNVPDTRGIFIRGAGSQTISGQTYSGTLAAKQTDDLKSHRHDSTTVSQSHSSANSSYANIGGTGGTSYPQTTGYTGGTETRPANISFTYIIKY